MGYEFALVLDHNPNLDELDRLFDEGCHDAAIEVTAEGPVALFDRQSTSLTEAISSAIHAVERAGFRTVEVIGEAFDKSARTVEYAREIAAANLMVSARTYLSAQRGRQPSATADA